MATPPTPTSGALTVNATTGVILSPVTAALFRSANGIGSGSGTVTSVAMTVPSFLSIAGSPITTSGTLALTLSGTALPLANGGTGATSLTATALLLGGASAITPADLTYISPTLSVPDAFVVSSAGSIGLTAGGSNKSITLTPSGTGVVFLGGTQANNPPAPTNYFANINRGLAVSFVGSTPTISGVRLEGSLGAPSPVAANNTLLSVGGMGYDTSAYATGAAILFRPMETWTTGTHGSFIEFDTTNSGSTTLTERWRITQTGQFLANGAASISGGAGNMTVIAGTGNSRTLTLQTTTSGGVATNALILDAAQDATFGGNLVVSTNKFFGTSSTNKFLVGGSLQIVASNFTYDFNSSGTITGGAGNMTITAGTGASRTLTFQTTTSGSTATNALVLSATQNATFGGSITTSAPNGGTAGAWKGGIRVAATVVFDTSQYIQLDVGGTLYKLAVCV